MKILILTRYGRDFSPFIFEICKWFSKMDNNILLLTPKKTYHFSSRKIEEHNPKAFFKLFTNVSKSLDIEQDLSYLGYILRAFTEGKKFEPDIILYIGSFAYFNPIAANLVAKTFRVPCVGDWLGSDLLLNNKSFHKILKKSILELNTCNFVQSKDMAKKAKIISNSASIVVSPDKGVDLNRFKPGVKTNSHINILFVGRFHPIKGIEYLIEAFKDINNEYPETKLILVGDGDLIKYLKDKVNSYRLNDHVKFCGDVEYENIVSYYQKADIFVLPSFSEGLSNVLMEAMACGLPVVATDVGGNKELIDEGKGGILVSSNSSDELKMAIIRLINNKDLRMIMAEYNRHKVKSYSQNNVMLEKVDLMYKCCNENK